jgi:hypothetical protein
MGPAGGLKDVYSVSVATSVTEAKPGDSRTAIASCKEKTYLVGGGYELIQGTIPASELNLLVVRLSKPASTTSWEVEVVNAGTEKSWGIVAWAHCAQAN